MPSRSNNGGWVPVVKQWKGGRGKGMDATHGLFSVFVDNIPSKMDGKSLFRFFSKFGIVKDAFIPSKRRVVSHSRFGFVRFNCHVAAAIAIQKANGLLVDDKVLEVKTATLDRRSREEHNRRYSEVMKTQFNKRSSEVNIFKRHVSSTGQRRSYVDVLQGVKTNTTIKVTEEGNGWLSGSAIIRFNTEYSIPSVTEALKEKGLNHLLVRKGGGRDVILTFNSQEELRSNIGNLKVWFKDLCQFVVEWKSGVHFVQERCVWLKCFGIPLQFWNRNTLNKIGSTWGPVLGIEEDSCQPKSFSHARIRVATPTMELITQSVNLECKGKVYTMLVCEDHLPVLSSMHHNGMCELSFLETCCSVKEANFPVVEGREMGEDDEVAVASAMFGAEIACTHEEIQGKHHTDTVVEQTLCDGGAIREGGACDGKNLTDLMEKSAHISKCNDEREKCAEEVFTPGFIRCFNEPCAERGSGIHLEVDLAHYAQQPEFIGPPCRPTLTQNNNVNPEIMGLGHLSHSGNFCNFGPYIEGNTPSSQSAQDSLSASITDQQRKERKKGKMKTQIEGFTSFARIHAYTNSAAKKHYAKSVIFRPAVKALAQPSSCVTESSLRNQILSEAAATIQLGKSLGIDYHGKEDIVLNKIMDLEIKDKERIVKERNAQQ